MFAGTKGLMDTIPVDRIREFEKELLDFIEEAHNGILVEIREKKKIEDEGKVSKVIQDFAESFMAGKAADVRD